METTETLERHAQNSELFVQEIYNINSMNGIQKKELKILLKFISFII